MGAGTIDIHVPGAVYYEALDPLATQVPAELRLPDPRIVKHGRGARYFYAGLSRWQAEEVASHLIDLGTTLLGSVDSNSRLTLRACIAAGQRIRKQLETERTHQQQREAR
jgi:hypothetical protein